MMSPAKTIWVWSFYLFFFGAGFLFVPNVVLGILDFPEAQEVWIRFFGLLAIVVGIYYAFAAKHQDRMFFRVSVWGRLVFVSGEIAFVLLHFVSPIVLIFAGIEFLSAVWTYYALKTDQSKAT